MNTFLQLLSGTWFIISTNFPMWLSGDKLHPAFNYTVSERRGKPGLIDEVRYEQNGKVKIIKGFDKPRPDNEKAFVWRGDGLLAIAKSNWEVRLIDPAHQWAVIWFSKTLFTREGVDIISRQKTLDNATLKKIKDAMLKDEVLKKHVTAIKEL